MSQFSIGEAFKQGWALTKKHFGFLIGVIVFVFAISFILQLILQTLSKGMSGGLSGEGLVYLLLYIVAYIVTVVVGGLLAMGEVKIFLALVDQKPTQFSDLFTCLHLFWNYLGAGILYGLIVFGGLILLIVPGIRWAIKYQFYMNVIVEKGVGPIEALKISGAMTRGYKWQLLGLGVLLMLVNLLGLLILVVGLFVTIPLSVMTLFVAYRMLTEKIQNPEAVNKAKSPSPQPVQTPA